MQTPISRPAKPFRDARLTAGRAVEGQAWRRGPSSLLCAVLHAFSMLPLSFLHPGAEEPLRMEWEAWLSPGCAWEAFPAEGRNWCPVIAGGMSIGSGVFFP